LVAGLVYPLTQTLGFLGGKVLKKQIKPTFVKKSLIFNFKKLQKYKQITIAHIKAFDKGGRF
jgi:hypothetical protein